MFTRLNIALIGLVLLGPSMVLAGGRETRRSESLQKYRSLCVTVVSRSSSSSTKSQAARFLELSRLRSWANGSGKTIHATYLGHGQNDQGETMMYLEKPDGTQYGIRPAILSSESRLVADELESLVPAITRDAQRLEDELQARVWEEEQIRQEREQVRRNRVGVSAAVAAYQYPTIEPNPVVYRHLYQPRTYWTGFYGACPYNPWAAGPFTTVGCFGSGCVIP